MAQTRYEAAEAIRRTNHGGGFPRTKNGISLSEKMFQGKWATNRLLQQSS
jgi:hypothetical protein